MSSRVRKSIRALVLLKPLSAVFGLVVLVILSRALSPSEYGGYFSALAIVEIAILVSNFGLLHAAYRYISATEGADGQLIPRGPVEVFTVARLATLVITVCIGWVIISLLPSYTIARIISPSLLWYVAIIILGEGLARFIEVLFESMLSQYRSQITLILRSIIRVIGNGVLVVHGAATLELVLIVECIAVSIASVVGIVMLRGLVVRAKLLGDARDWRVDRPFIKMAWRFALPGYGAQILGICYGVDVLKLMLGWTAGPEEVALFGFCFSIASVVQRYMPANIFAGVLRPIFVAAGKRADSVSVLNALFGVSVKINWFFIIAVLVFVAPASSPVTMMVSAGNYKQAGEILLVLIASLLFVSSHLLQSSVSVAVENTKISLIATAVVAATVPVAFLVAYAWGALGLSWYCVLSEFVWVVAFRYLVANCGLVFKFDYVAAKKMIVAGIVALVLGWFVAKVDGYWVLASTVSSAMFVAATLRCGVFNDADRLWLKMVLPGRLAHIFG